MRALALLLFLATPAAAEVPQVVTDIPPVAALVAGVMGNLGTPEVFLDRGTDEHELLLKPQQMVDLNAAGLVVWVGPELTPGLAEAVKGAGVPSLTLLDAPGTHRLDYAGGGVNPHAWLDPSNAEAWVGVIADRLATLDPANAEAYRANAADTLYRLTAMDGQMKARLTGLKPFMTYHDAYAYLARAYALPYQGGLAAGEAATPGAARLAEVQDQIARGSIACLFPEEAHDPALLTGLASAQTKIGPALNPVGSDLPPLLVSYGILMVRLADALATCR